MKHLIICGDVHEKFREFRYRIKNFIENAIVVVAGDIGMGFHKPGTIVMNSPDLIKFLRTKMY